MKIAATLQTIVFFLVSFDALSQNINFKSNRIDSVCTGFFYDDGGISANYSNSSRGSHTLTSKNGERIALKFLAFNLYTSDYDNLAIYDGPNNNYPLIGYFYGANPPDSVISSGTSLTFTFTSSSSNNSSGWVARISCAGKPLPKINFKNNTTDTICEAVFYDDGGPTANYYDNKNIAQTFCSDSTGKSLVAFFNNAATSFSSGDTLTVYDGSSNSSQKIGRYVGGSYIETIQSTGQCLTFEFESDATANSTGWQAFLSCETQQAQPNSYNMSEGTRFVCNGLFYDSGGKTSNYSDKEDITQTFVSNTGNRIAFKFTQFFLASKYDYLEAYDGPNRNYPMMGLYYYGDHPDSLISSKDAITFRFYSSNSDNSAGWVARISCGGPVLQRIDLKNNKVDTTCNAVYYDNGGSRRNYYDNTNATNTICASDTGKFLNATFNYWGYDLRPEDTLAIYDGTSVNARPLVKHTFSDKPEPLQAKSGCLTFNFTSNKTINSRGWQAFIKCDSTVLKPTEYRIEAGVRYTCNGTFTDPGGATANYPGSANKTQTFITPTNGRLAFIFRDFDLDYRYDYLNIYDGPSTSSKLIGSFRENNSPDTVISTGKALTFYFYANNIYQERGWIADIHCIEDLYTPKITTKKVQCKGDSMVLNAKTISGVEYQWFGPNGFYSTKAKPVIRNIDTKNEGTYKLVVKSWGRVSDTAYIKINVFAKPSSPTISVKGNNSICTGDSVELISSALVRNIWSTGDTTKSIFVSKQGTYNTVYVGFSGCKSKPSSSTIINLLKTPSQPKILVQGDTLLCEGDTLALISSQNILNRWSTGDSTQTLKVSKAGIYTVKTVGFNGCFSKTSTPLTVKTLKSPAAPIVTANGNTDLCFGDSTLLTASSIEPIIWSNGKTARQIWVKTTGNISAKAIGSNGCASIESNVIGIDVSTYYEAPKITAFGNLNFCEGDTVELSSSYSSGNQWSNGKTSQILKIYTSEKLWVKFRDAKGCESESSDTLILNMIERPGFPIITEFIKDSLKASTNAESYDWFYEGNKLGLKTQKISAPATGSYTVIAYANNCPSIESMPYSFTHSNISKNNSAHISLFPNPTTGLIELKSDLEIEAITVSSVNGNIIQKVYDPKTQTIDLSMFDKGTYIIQIISNQKVYQKAVVKY